MTIDITKVKIGETINEDMLDGVLKAPLRLLAITYTVFDKDGTKMDLAVKHEDFDKYNKEVEE